MFNCTYCEDRGTIIILHRLEGNDSVLCPYCRVDAPTRASVAALPSVKPEKVVQAEERRIVGVEKLELLGADIAGEIRRMCLIVSMLNSLWEIDIHTGEPIEPDYPEMLMLTVSELSEALEGHRKDCQDDHLPSHKMFDVEIADAVIRLFHIAARKGIDLGPLIVEKCLYNVARPDHQYAARIAKGGKKI